MLTLRSEKMTGVANIIKEEWKQILTKYLLFFFAMIIVGGKMAGYTNIHQRNA